MFWKKFFERRQLKRFAAQASFGVTVKSIHGEYITISEAAREVLGLDQDDIDQARPDNLYMAETAALVARHDLDVLTMKKAQIRDIPIQLNGHKRVFRVKKFPIVGRNGAILGIGSFSEDITEELSTEARLLESEARYRELFEQSPIPFIEEDWSEVLTQIRALVGQGHHDLAAYFNANPIVVTQLYDSCIQLAISSKIATLYRATDMEHFTRTLKSEFADPDEIAGFTSALVALFSGAESYSYEAKETDLSGAPMVTRVTVSIPPKYAQNWRKVLISSDDITAAKEIESRANESRHLESLGKISGGVAHDFNNLLTVIRGGADLLAIGKDPDTEIVSTIIAATERGADLTKSLLAYARQQPLQPEIVDLSGLVNEMKPLLERAVGAQNRLSFGDATVGWSALVDPARFRDAVLNLILNANESSQGQNEIEIKLEWTNKVPAKVKSVAKGPLPHALVLSVTDAGSGMAPEVEARAFEPFFSTKRIGSGLGLSSVYGFAEQSGGGATITTEPGKGTKVSLFLPATNAHQQTKNDLYAGTEVIRGKGERILIVEDEPKVGSIIVGQLDALGYTTQFAENASEAMDLCTDPRKFDLVISDIVLSGSENGVELANRLRDENHALPLLLMTGYDPTGRDFLPKASTDFPILAKPFGMRELSQIVASTLNSSDADRRN